MSEKVLWQKYITAQSKILEHKSRPIGIDTKKSVQLNGLKLHLSIDQEIFKQEFRKVVEEVFHIADFDFGQDYILADLALADTDTFKAGIKKMTELAEICYIDFNENPVIEGVITGQDNNSKEELKNVIGELPTNYHFKNSGMIFLTIDEWKKVKQIQGLKFNKKAGAVFPINYPIKSVMSKISSYYRQIDISNHHNLIEIKGELHPEIATYFEINFGVNEYGKCLLFEFEDADILKQKLKELEKKGVTLGTQIGKVLRYQYTNKFLEDNDTSLSFELYRLKRAIKYHLSELIFEVNYSTRYSIDETIYFHQIANKFNSESFQISQTKRTISFDYETEEELIEKLEFVKSFSFFDISDFGENHKYKFNIKFETGLHELQTKLKKEIPYLNTKLIANGEKLIFRQFYQTGNKTEILARLNNQLNDFVDSESFDCTINDTFQEKYLCEENFELKVEQEEEKLSKLLREEFYFGNPQKEKFYLGKLQKVDYPDLYFVVDEERIEEVKENISEETVKAIFPDLKGEKDKIKRLEDTVLKLDDEKTKLPNDNAKVFLYDSSKAKTIENIDYLLNKTSAEWQDFEEGIFPLNKGKLNDSQKQAIFKTLYAEELALIQGPPGTGKSTAIAEIIWQHIRKEPKQKILLTSETNLAVDNAIDRLKNRENNVVKPIRFGNTENLESEGYFYSLDAIENWQKSNSTEINTVSHWLCNIANRVKPQDDEQIDSALDKWKNHLQKPNNDTKKLFAEKYLEYVNLIGATGSSIGKLNSENKWTSFFRSYLNVFYSEDYKNSSFDKSSKSRCYRVEINFDTVIMDEASKATPPELALPVLFGKKSIIVGDHRQLPPMIDGEEIKDLLVSIGEKALAKTLSHKEFEISQFERLFKNIDDSIKGTFDTQYRMHPAINEAISQFYKDDGGLKCGLPLEETYHNSFEKWDSRYHGLKFKSIITPETHTIWIDVKTPEIKEGTSRVNFGEIEAIDNILTALKNSNGKNEFDKWLSNKTLEEKQIGLISFYGKQIHYINKMLKEKHNEVPIRLSTVDRFQGMERNIIIVSMVRSNKLASFQGQQPDEIYGELGYSPQESLGFAESPNRLNVALSRARRLLIVVGNSEHFCRKDIYKNVFETIQKNGKIISAEELQNAVEQNG